MVYHFWEVHGKGYFWTNDHGIARTLARKHPRRELHRPSLTGSGYLFRLGWRTVAQLFTEKDRDRMMRHKSDRVRSTVISQE